MNTSQNNENVTGQEFIFRKEYIIWKLNENVYSEYFPCIIFNIVCILVGLYGNILVLYVYAHKFKQTTVAFFSVWLAIFDIMSSICLSFEILDKRFSMYSGTFGILCKLNRFMNFVAFTSGCGVILCIAIDRYYKVCRPLKFFSVRQGKIIFCTVFMGSVLIATPALAVYGTKTVETGIDGVFGKDCSTADEMKDSVIEKGFNSFLLLGEISSTLFLGIIYIKIYLRLRKTVYFNKHKAYSKIKAVCTFNFKTQKKIENSNNGIKKDHILIFALRNSGTNAAIAKLTFKLCGYHPDVLRLVPNAEPLSDISKINHEKLRNSEKNDSGNVCAKTRNSNSPISAGRGSVSRRITLVFAIVALGFILCTLPYCIVEIIRSVGLLDESKLSFSMKQFIRLLNSSYSVSYIINPIIYCVFYPEFRKEVKKLFIGQKIFHKLRS